jgi:NitT/TauT family transport system substrate-binding protein
MGGATTFVMLSTTTRFRDENPAVHRAVLRALADAQARIRADRAAAAAILLEAEGEGGFSVEEMVAVLEDPAVQYTATPQNIMRYARFMHDIGTIRTRPASWTDMFFPDIHDLPGS